MDGGEGLPSGTIHYPVLALFKLTPKLGVKKPYAGKMVHKMLLTGARIKNTSPDVRSFCYKSKTNTIVRLISMKHRIVKYKDNFQEVKGKRITL